MPGGVGGALKSLKPKMQSVGYTSRRGMGYRRRSRRHMGRTTLFPAKFHEGMWIRREIFSVADESSQIPIALGDGEIGSSDDGMPPPYVWGAM
ncbi:hypothetical protein YC2023_036590 [Brassica napus]